MNLSRGSRRAVKMSDERVVPILTVGARCANEVSRARDHGIKVNSQAHSKGVCATGNAGSCQLAAASSCAAIYPQRAAAVLVNVLLLLSSTCCCCSHQHAVAALVNLLLLCGAFCCGVSFVSLRSSDRIRFVLQMRGGVSGMGEGGPFISGPLQRSGLCEPVIN